MGHAKRGPAGATARGGSPAAASGGTSVNNLLGGNIYSPLEGHVGGRWVHSSGVNVNLGTGLGFTQAVGSPQFRMFLSVGYLPVEKKPVVVVVPPARGRLLAEKSGSGTGTVTSIPAGISCGQSCSADFKLGAQVVLTAQPGPDSRFIGWSGPCSGTGDCAVVMTGATRVGVEFARNEELRGTVTIEKEGEGLGIIASEPAGISCGKLCTASFRQDQELRLTAVPEKDSRFSGWEGPCTGLEPCTLVVRGDPQAGRTGDRGEGAREGRGAELDVTCDRAPRRRGVDAEAPVRRIGDDGVEAGRQRPTGDAGQLYLAAQPQARRREVGVERRCGQRVGEAERCVDLGVQVAADGATGNGTAHRARRHEAGAHDGHGRRTGEGERAVGPHGAGEAAADRR